VTVVAPWQVWWVDFDPSVGREQAGDRPAIVVGTPLACRFPNGLAIVVPCTRTNRGLAWQPEVVLAGSVGYAMCEQVKALPVERLRRRHPAQLDDGTITRVKFALRQVVNVA
jgi:mRNA interferase MazF